MTVLEVQPSVRIAIIGDVGGHLGPLQFELARLGVPEEGAGEIPPDLRLIQVGDLVHRGPDSAGVVALVDRHLRSTPGRWVQLVGNHEAFYLRRRQFTWDDRVPAATAATLRRWWREGLMNVAVAIRAGQESFVVTHGGVTRGFWASVLAGPSDVGETVDALNALRGRNDRALFRAGTMVDHRQPDPLVGPIWANAGAELSASWLDRELPFSQVHGHSSIYDWQRMRWLVDGRTAALATRDDPAKHVVLELAGGRLIGVDPGHRAMADGTWHAYVFNRRRAPPQGCG